MLDTVERIYRPAWAVYIRTVSFSIFLQLFFYQMARCCLSEWNTAIMVNNLRLFGIKNEEQEMRQSPESRTAGQKSSLPSSESPYFHSQSMSVRPLVLRVGETERKVTTGGEDARPCLFGMWRSSV